MLRTELRWGRGKESGILAEVWDIPCISLCNTESTRAFRILKSPAHLWTPLASYTSCGSICPYPNHKWYWLRLMGVVQYLEGHNAASLSKTWRLDLTGNLDSSVTPNGDLALLSDNKMRLWLTCHLKQVYSVRKLW